MEHDEPIIYGTGYVSTLEGGRRRKKKQPLGFAPPKEPIIKKPRARKK